MLTFLVRTCCDWYDNRIMSSTPFLLRVSVRGRVFFAAKKQWNEFLSKMNRLQQKDGIKYGNLSHDAGNDTAAKYCTPEEKMVKYF